MFCSTQHQVFGFRLEVIASMSLPTPSTYRLTPTSDRREIA